MTNVLHIAELGNPLCGIADLPARLPDDHFWISSLVAKSAIKHTMLPPCVCERCLELLTKEN